MPESGLAFQTVRAIRRNWWLVAAVLAVAVVAGGAVSAYTAETTYEATADIAANTSVITRNAIPKQEEMMAELQASEDFYSMAASETGVPEAELRARTGAYTDGRNIEWLRVTYESPRRETAESMAERLARLAVVHYRQLAEEEISKASTFLALAEDLLEKTKSTEFAATQFRTADEADLYKQERLRGLKIEVINHASSLDSLMNAYEYTGETTVRARARSDQVKEAMIGAAFLGLVAGVALAAVREVVLTRRSR